MSIVPTDLEAAVEAREAAHQAWLAAASPPAPRTVLVSDDESRTRWAAWDLWAAACRRVSDLVEAMGGR
jgi:hypothetical protein